MSHDLDYLPAAAATVVCVNQVFTVYVVKVTSGISGRYWIIERRYSDFRQLHDTIRRKVGRPPLPLSAFENRLASHSWPHDTPQTIVYSLSHPPVSSLSLPRV